jgi:hypothetical protein
MQSAFAGLPERVDAALARAAQTHRRSLLVRAASAQRRDGGFTTVCAWCGAFAIGAEFFAPGEEPAFARRGKVTHGICPACLDELRRSGQTN